MDYLALNDAIKKGELGNLYLFQGEENFTKERSLRRIMELWLSLIHILNCDHSLLTYSFYKQPRFVLKLFQIRLREIMKINAVPAGVIGVGLALILFATGGTDNPLNYAVLVVSILCMSLFFSIHYLTIYYLLQPYNAGTELKSGTYSLVLSATYLACFFMMQLRMPTLVFGMMTIVFCVLYSVVACVLVYRFAPKTFRIRT